jgi:hypothetical protein
MWEKFVNYILRRQSRFDRLKQQLLERLASEATEDVLMLLLDGMELAFLLDPQFRKNLKDFNARYLLVTKSGDFHVAVICEKNRMSAYKKRIDNCNVQVVFSDYKSIIDLLTHPDPDILDLMLAQKLDFTGNLNYIYKFGYLARHLLHNLQTAL